MKLIARLGLVGSVIFLVWGALAVMRGDWLLLAVFGLLWLMSVRTSALGGLGGVAGAAVSVYTGEWWLFAAFVLLLVSRLVPRLLPLWMLRKRADQSLLLNAINSVDHVTANALVQSSRGGPISTVSLIAAARDEVPGRWEQTVDLSGEGSWDGPLLRDRIGRRWTAHAAEAVVIAERLTAEGARLTARQTLGAGALLVPESALTDLLPAQSNPYDIAERMVGFSSQDIRKIMMWFVKSPAGGDAMRRVELRMTIDPERDIAGDLLFTVRGRRFWMLYLGVKFIVPIAVVSAIGEGIGGLFTRRRRPAAADRPPAREPQPATSAPPAHEPRPATSMPRSEPQPRKQSTRPGRARRVADYLRLSAAATSWWDTLLLRVARPALTVAAVAAAALTGLPWWGRVLVALGVLLGRPMRQWWLDLVWMVCAATAGLFPLAVVLASRAVVTGVVVARHGTETAVAGPRRVFVSTLTGSERDRILRPDEAWTAYLRSLQKDDEFGDGAVEYLLSAWTTGDVSALVRAGRDIVRIEVFGIMPVALGRASVTRKLFRLMVLEGATDMAPRLVTAVGAAIAAWIGTPAGDLLSHPVRVADAWAAAAGSALFAWLVTRRQPAKVSASVLGLVLLLWLGTAALPTLATVIVGASLGWTARRALTRRALNIAPRLSWVGRRVTGLRRHSDFQAASALDTAGRPGVAIGVLTDAAAATASRRPAAAAVALAHCALIERDRGDVQRAVEHADSAREMAVRTRSRVANGVVSYAEGMVMFAVGDYPGAKEALRRAEPVLRRRPEGSTCAAVLAQVHAALNETTDAFAAAGRTAGRLTTPGQLPALVESQLAAGWAQLRTGQAAEAKEYVEDVLEHFEDPFGSDEADPDERTQDLWRRLMGEACLLLGRIHLALDEPAAARASLDRGAGHLRPTAASGLLGMTRIYQGQCYRLAGQWAAAREAVAAGIDLLEERRGELRAGAQRASAVASGTDHYGTALAVLVEAQHHGDAEAGVVAAGLIESLRRNALATMLRDERAALVDQLSPEALDTMAEITRLEGRMDLAGRTSDGEDISGQINELRGRLQLQVSRGFAAAYSPDRVDYAQLTTRTRHAHVLQYEVLEAGPHRWRGYRVWIPPFGSPWVDEIVIIDPEALSVLEPLYRGKRASVMFQDFDDTIGVWTALARALLPAGLVTELRQRPATDPVRLLVVPGEHLAYLPWAPLLLDDSGEADLLLHKAVIHVVPSLNLLHPATNAAPGGQILAYADAWAQEMVQRGGAFATPWRHLRESLPLIVVGSREEFERYLSDPRVDGIYLAAHGDGSGLAQSINFSQGGKLSAASALRFRWPRSLVFASCFVAKVEHQAGHEPLGLAIACMLGGCQSVIGGLVEVERQATGEITTDVTIAVAAGADPPTALRDAQRAYLDREGALMTNEWGGLVCISTEWRSA